MSSANTSGLWHLFRDLAARPSARQAFYTVGAFGVAQLIVMVGAFVRIPLITDAIGAVGYGLFIVITSVNPVVSVLAGGLAGAARVSTASHPCSTGAITRRLRWFGLVEMLALSTIALLVAFAGAQLYDPVVMIALGASIFSVSLLLPLAPYSGALEAHNRTALAHLSLAMNTLVGVPLLIVGLLLEQSILVVVVATGLGLLAPVIVNLLLVRRLTPYRHTLSADVPESVNGENLRRLSMSMTGWSVANLMVYAFDALIVAAAVGVVAAGEYGLAGRIVILVTVVPEALGNLLTVHFTQLRLSGRSTLLARRIMMVSAILAGLGVALGTAFSIWGPWLANLLSNGKVDAPSLMYVMFGVYGAITASTQAFLSACAAPGIAKMRARIGIIGGLVNIALSYPFALWLGPAGPVAASALCISGIAIALIVHVTKHPDRLLH